MFHTTAEAKSARVKELMSELGIQATMDNCDNQHTFCPGCQTGSLHCRLNQSTGNCAQQEIDAAWFEFINSNEY